MIEGSIMIRLLYGRKIFLLVYFSLFCGEMSNKKRLRVYLEKK